MELYHVFNRSVEKRTIFRNERDHLRFVCSLRAFNTKKSVEIFSPKGDWAKMFLQSQERTSKGLTKSLLGEPLVDIHAWCAMGNHYHLLLSARTEGGLTTFIRKLNIGYAKYYNEKYDRSGTLFQGRTKKVLIEREAHFLYILHYIHLNPLDFLKGAKSWREGYIGNAQKAIDHLENYRWSSYLDYCGRKNFPSLITTGLFGDVFRDYKKELSSYVRDIEMDPIRDFVIE